jgi:galactokinase
MTINAGPDQNPVARALAEHFRERFGASPQIFRAPGRVNLIGEHTDYNDGFVMPAAIDSYTWVAGAPRTKPSLRVYSEHFDETVELPLAELSGAPREHWSDYIRGVAAVLSGLGKPVGGADLLISSDVPLGAGLSSSAALEVAVASALAAMSGVEVPALQLVKACQKAEHEYAGTRCGIMDQFIATFAQAGHALMLDCRSLEYRLLPVANDVRIVICNSMVKHALASGEYNRRRAECEAGVEMLRGYLPHVRALRDVSMADLEQHASDVSDVVLRRCRHVITENQRVLSAVEALQGGDLRHFGKLMYESHHSLRDDYQVSCDELDFLTELASECDGVYGARMTGGGFGGCTVNLVRADTVERLREHLIAGYQEKTGKTPEVYVCAPADGARGWWRGSNEKQ